MVDEISSEMEGSEKFDSMSEEDIDNLLDKNEVETSSESTVQSQSTEKPQDQKPKEEAAPVTDETAENQPLTEPTIGELSEKLSSMEKLLTRVSRETGQGRKMYSEMADLRKQFENKNPTQLPSQEEQAAQARLNEMFKGFVEENYGDLINDAKESRETRDHFKEIREIAGEEDFPRLDPFIARLYDEKSKAAYEDGDEAAERWMNRADKDRSFVVLEATRLASKEAESTETNAKDARSAAGRKAAVTTRTSSQPLPKGEPTQAQLDKMSEKELDELLDKSGVR